MTSPDPEEGARERQEDLDRLEELLLRQRGVRRQAAVTLLEEAADEEAQRGAET